jgi:outer membrane protein OmpA-like peptidoglycan-associated protein
MEGDYATIPDPISIYFAFDSHSLTPEATEVIDEVAALLVSDKGLNLEINGYTDTTGPATYNQQLSEKRAMAVGRYLIESMNVSGSRLTLAGRGETTLFDQTNDPKGHSANRMVELVFTRDVVAAQ